MKRKQNWISKISIIFITIFLTITVFANDSFADVGSFESYDSGSDWGGSSWGSDWGSSSSSWGSSWDDDDDYGYYGGYYGDDGDITWFDFLAIMIIVISVIIVLSKIKGGKNPPPPRHNSYQTIEKPGMYEASVLAKVKAIDPDFNKENFVAWSKTLFVKLQESWTACDWETIRTFETKELFEQHKAQLQGYINNHTINVMDRICVNYAYLYNFKQEGGQDVLTIELNSTMIDYIMDANTEKVLRGDKTTRRTNTYLLTFVRTTGVKTTKVTGELDTTNCPNCGAPTKITSSGKCEYCGSVITTDKHDWALANLQRK